MANKFEVAPSGAEEKSQEEIEAGRLNLDDAQKEANMVSAKREKVAFRDYERAFQAIQEIKRLAEEEPQAEKVLYQLGRIIHGVGRVPGMLLSTVLWDLEYAASTSHQRSMRTVNGEGLPLEDLDNWLLNKLTDAEKVLKHWEKEGKKFEKSSKES